jgi:hypothetical protein
MVAPIGKAEDGDGHPGLLVRALEASEVPSAFLSFAQLRNRSANLDVWCTFYGSYTNR